MVDIAKKVNKKSELLEQGEAALAATTLMKKGQFNKSVAAGAIGGVVGHLAAARMNKGDQDVAGGSMADEFPQMAQSILALTNQRWILFEQSVMSGGPKEIVGAWPHEAIVSIEVEKGKLMSKLTLTFSDGSAVALEAPKANKPAKLVDEAQKYCVAL